MGERERKAAVQPPYFGASPTPVRRTALEGDGWMELGLMDRLGDTDGIFRAGVTIVGGVGLGRVNMTASLSSLSSSSGGSGVGGLGIPRIGSACWVAIDDGTTTGMERCFRCNGKDLWTLGGLDLPVGDVLRNGDVMTWLAMGRWSSSTKLGISYVEFGALAWAPLR
jgi:hypothetical protein